MGGTKNKTKKNQTNKKQKQKQKTKTKIKTKKHKIFHKEKPSMCYMIFSVFCPTSHLFRFSSLDDTVLNLKQLQMGAYFLNQIRIWLIQKHIKLIFCPWSQNTKTKKHKKKIHKEKLSMCQLILSVFCPTSHLFRFLNLDDTVLNVQQLQIGADFLNQICIWLIQKLMFCPLITLDCK